jgi:hypothetical protein
MRFGLRSLIRKSWQFRSNYAALIPSRIRLSFERRILEARASALITSLAAVPQIEHRDWPIDVRLCGVLSAFWAAYLVFLIFMRDPVMDPEGPLRALIGGVPFYGRAAQFVLLGQAAIFWAIAVGITARRRWGLIVALFYSAQAMIGRLVFILTYLGARSEIAHVKSAALEGAALVILTLYLWVRTSELAFSRSGPSMPHRGAVL